MLSVYSPGLRTSHSEPTLWEDKKIKMKRSDVTVSSSDKDNKVPFLIANSFGVSEEV